MNADGQSKRGAVEIGSRLRFRFGGTVPSCGEGTVVRRVSPEVHALFVQQFRVRTCAFKDHSILFELVYEQPVSG